MPREGRPPGRGVPLGRREGRRSDPKILPRTRREGLGIFPRRRRDFDIISPIIVNTDNLSILFNFEGFGIVPGHALEAQREGSGTSKSQSLDF